MNLPAQPIPLQEGRFLRLAAEIAMEISPLADILRAHNIGEEEWERIQKTARFQMLLLEAVKEWNAATNTPDRVKVKSAVMLEQSLPDMYGHLIDSRHPLAAKTELLKLIAKLAGVDNTSKGDGIAPERFVLNINIGDNVKRAIGISPEKVIEHS